MNPRPNSPTSVRFAGVASILAGCCWIVGIIVGSDGNDDPSSGSVRIAKLSLLMIAGWNLLLVPAAIVLWQRARVANPDLIGLYTICGIISLMFWAYGGATHSITPSLEIVYLLLSGVWWVGIGNALWSEQRALGIFTLMLGLFALLDAVFSFFEPMPFYIYALAAPKLPLSIIWDFWIGAYFLRSEFKNNAFIETSSCISQTGSSRPVEHRADLREYSSRDH